VHMTGGMAGLVGAAIAGPRRTVFEGARFKVTVHTPRPFSLVFETLGVIFLWAGWYGFNCGSAWAYTGEAEVAELIAVNTSLSGAAGLFTCVVIFGAKSRFDILPLDAVINGALAGLVGVTPACAVIDPPLAVLTGVVAAIGSSYLSGLVHQFKIDDPVDAFAVHYGSGLWGIIVCGLFATPENIRLAYPGVTNISAGVFYGDNSFTLLGWQLVMCLTVTAWVGGCAAVVFSGLNYFGFLRVSAEAEGRGCDAHHHGVAYDSANAVPQSAPEKTNVHESAFVHRVMSLLSA